MRKKTLKIVERLISENKPIGYVVSSNVKDGVLVFKIKSDYLTARQLAEVWGAMLEATNISNFSE